MQSIRFDSGEIEARHEMLGEYAYKMKKAVEELSGELQSLAFETQKVIDKICFSHPTRTAEDGAKGKIECILSELPQKRLERLERERENVESKRLHWGFWADAYRDQIDSEYAEIDNLRKQISELPKPEWDSDSGEYIDPCEQERERLNDEIQFKNQYLHDEISPKRTEACRNRDIAQKDLNKLDELIFRCNKIISQAITDSAHAGKALASLKVIIESLKKYSSKLEKFASDFAEIIEKSEKIFGKALRSVNDLKALSHRYIEGFGNDSFRVKFDLDECKKYQSAGVEFNEEVKDLYRAMIDCFGKSSDWNDGLRDETYEVLSTHGVALKNVLELFENETDFLKKQISVLTDYYNSVK